MSIYIEQTKSTFKLPEEIKKYFIGLMQEHNEKIPVQTSFIEQFNMNISLHLDECRIETMCSSYDRQKPYWATSIPFPDLKEQE